MNNANQKDADPVFGSYGAFLEDSVKHVLKHKPHAIGICGILDDGQTIGAYYQANASDKLQMAGIIQYDAIIDVIRENAKEINGYLNEEVEE